MNKRKILNSFSEENFGSTLVSCIYQDQKITQRDIFKYILAMNIQVKEDESLDPIVINTTV